VIQWDVLNLKYFLQLFLAYTVPIFHISFTDKKVCKMFCNS
jgi:hypothetical protein